MSEKGKDYILFLEDIAAALDRIEKYSGTLTYEQFSGNAMVIDAVIRNFEIIVEATKSIPKEVQERYHAVECREAAGFRDVLIHDFGIDIEALWLPYRGSRLHHVKAFHQLSHFADIDRKPEGVIHLHDLLKAGVV